MNCIQMWPAEVGAALSRKAESIHLRNIVDILRRRKAIPNRPNLGLGRRIASFQTLENAVNGLFVALGLYYDFTRTIYK